MKYNIIITDHFFKSLKKLSKKYPSLKTDLDVLGDSLAEHPQQGTPIGHDCYKIRLGIASKGKGKSGGGRVITHVLVKERNVYLISIYDKSDQDSISDKELLRLITDL